MKIVALFLIAFVVVSASFLPTATATAASGSTSKRSGESCTITHQKLNALHLCFDGMSRGMKLPNSCCESMKEQEACLCDVIQKRVTLSKSIISSHLKSCGVPEPNC
ncbi:hypothetical protein CARUB_v10021722mg [Capsella rubella]|uniref:Bifunctional inhibitor/plant lipid transfer protein/seed storage helical domain-containing protein n=1 Tax=Capsella rubella TaxID=81985 RepID=R0I9M6_9BRAS|nr:non-specific lipid-transfer protein 2 [Capsella rubella]EOA33243.1 hypothetical protein CARUB_v10021722mg [Capsella rubella]